MSQLLHGLRHAELRANPAYELVVYDRLTAAERDACGPLLESPDFYGILRSPAGELTIKSVSREAALLWLTLREPGVLPEYYARLFGLSCSKNVAQLVLDDVLQIEEQGRFVGGPEAHPLLMAELGAVAGQGANAALSLAAIRHAEGLQLDDPTRLTARIYFYNRLPVSPRWRREIPDDEAELSYLGLAAEGPEGWQQVDDMEGWRSFRHRSEPVEGRLGFKLYVTPRMEGVRETLWATADALARCRVSRFKLGRGLPGLLRPDKLVAYCHSKEQLLAAADLIHDRLSGMSVHGVPLTAEVAGEGLISWGMDPPAETQVLAWQERTSWRQWLASRLASALVASQAASSGPPPWRYALDRIRLEGVDPDTWCPRESLWRET